MNTFKIKTQVKFGDNALTYLSSLENKRVFIIADPFMKTSGLLEKIKQFLTRSEFTIFDEVVPDPPVEAVVKGVEKASEYKPDVIIALGGGSAIDEAKAIMYCAKNVGNLKQIEFIAIPTTSGTGSEVTSFAVITDKQKGVKYPLVSEELLPDTAILSTELVKTVPKGVTADTGIDVLTHAIEAYVSTSATDFSDALAEKAVSMVFEYLHRSYKNAEDIEAREKMHSASCIAGLAFNLASLGLNHAIAHNIGAKLHVPHGRTNAILLPHVIEFNAQDKHAAKKYARLAKICGINTASDSMAVKGLISAIKKLEREINMPVRFNDVQVDRDIKQQIAAGAMKDACIVTNPIVVTENDIVRLLDKVMG